MKRFAIPLLILAAFLFCAKAWTNPILQFQKAVSIASISGAISLAPFVSNAIDFSGSYSDPNHPNCQRLIKQSGEVVSLSGTDGTPGCPPDGSGRPWKLTGKAVDEDIFVDFSPKGGPANLKGVWDNDGIRWPDGNKWSLKK